VKLNEIKDNPKALTEKKRVGRGIGSGLGKTCGRGVKGQKSRTGVALKGFEGGQTPIYRRLPKRGFVMFARKRYVEISLEAIARLVDQKRLDSSVLISEEILQAAGLFKKASYGVKILCSNLEKFPSLKIEVSSASSKARALVEKFGGTLTVLDQKTSSAS
jgi:large subunit ribosomal protein L15